MNYQEKYGSFNQKTYLPMQGPPSHRIQHNYSQYQGQPQSQLVMAQMSQEPIDLRNQYSAYDYSDARAPEMHSLSFKNLSLKNSNPLVNNQDVGFDNSSQNLQNGEQADIETLISPIILKAMTVLKNCELNPNTLKDLTISLKEKLYTLKKVRKNFNERMQQLIQIAQNKQQTVKKLLRKKDKRLNMPHSRSRSRSNIKSKPVDKSQETKMTYRKKPGPKPKKHNEQQIINTQQMFNS